MQNLHLTYAVRDGIISHCGEIDENHLKPRFGMYKLKALNSAAIQEFANDLKLNGLAKNSVIGIIATLSGALNYAIEPLHYIQYNPWDRRKYPKY